MPGRSRELHVHVHKGEIVVTQPEHGFCAVYVKPTNSPLLVLKHRAQTTDEELKVRACKAANDKARELGCLKDRKMDRPFWDYALGVAIALTLLGALLFWEGSCDGGWASGFECDFWTKGSNELHENPN